MIKLNLNKVLNSFYLYIYIIFAKRDEDGCNKSFSGSQTELFQFVMNE